MSGVFTQSSSLPSANGLTFAGWNQDHGERYLHVACIVACLNRGLRPSREGELTRKNERLSDRLES